MFNIARCESYSSVEVRTALKQIVDLSKFVKKGDKVLVKPNILMAASPDKAITTHPAVIRAVVEELLKIGAKIIIADSPGISYNIPSLHNIYRECGYEEFEKYLNYDVSIYEKGGYKLIKPFKNILLPPSGFSKDMSVL